MLKRIGILSMQKVINYGSYLQAYALKKMLLKAGAESVDFIDIIPGSQLPGLTTGSVKEKIKRLLGIVHKIISNKPSKVRELINFRQYYPKSIIKSWSSIGIGENNCDKNYDLVVIGSDEVFNCCNKNDWGFSPQLFGDIKNTKRCVSYAASFGSTTKQSIEEYGIKSTLTKLLNNFDYLSVRDENSKIIIKDLTGNNALIHIDPVLLYDFSKEIEKSSEKTEKNYIIIYTYPGRIHTKEEIKAIKQFAISREKKIFTIMCSYKWADRLIIPSTPFGVLKWFKNADFVITDTFHGSIFSIITGRNFVSILRESNINKLGFLLHQLGLSSRAVTPNQIENILSTKIDYASVYRKLNRYRKEAENYLSLILNLE